MKTPPAKMHDCHCLRCGHRWTKRIKGRPKHCPKCKQPNWDVKAGVLRRGPAPGSPEARRGGGAKKKDYLRKMEATKKEKRNYKELRTKMSPESIKRSEQKTAKAEKQMNKRRQRDS